MLNCSRCTFKQLCSCKTAQGVRSNNYFFFKMIEIKEKKKGKITLNTNTLQM